MKVLKYRRGQIWFYKMSNVYDGSVQGKSRPVIIMSNDVANEYSTCLLAIPCTTADKKSMPTHTNFWIDNTKNTALAENIMSVNRDKLVEYLGTVDDELLQRLEETVKIALGLKDLKITSNSKMTPIDIVNITQNDISPEPEPIMISTRAILDESKPTDEKPAKKRIKYSKEEKIRLVSDYLTFGFDYVIKKYKPTSRTAFSKRIWRYRKELNM